MWTAWANGLTSNVADEWMQSRQKMMSLLQEEAELEEIVKMVGMDALFGSRPAEDGGSPVHP